MKSSSSVKVFYPRYHKEELIKLIKERLEELNNHLPLKQVVLFGSYARGNYTVASDVDLLVIYRGESREGAYALVKKIVVVSLLQPHVYSEKESREIISTLHQMTKDGIILFP